MSRLSLKPGGEPGVWQVECADFGDLPAYRSLTVADVADEDLMDIQSVLAEYFAAKEPVAEKALFEQRGYVYIMGFIMFGFAIATAGFWYGWNRVPDVPKSTGGVIDQLCMRPEIECSTSIRYLHRQTGIVEQEYDTFPKAEAR